jgi:hypothetical protein
MAAVALIALTPLAACTQHPAEYSWANADSGEYLFDFDTRECDAAARRTLAATHEKYRWATESPAFFTCMQDRGYVLVDPKSGLALTPGVTSRRRAPVATQAGR